MVRKEGVEPTRPCGHRILSLTSVISARFEIFRKRLKENRIRTSDILVWFWCFGRIFNRFVTGFVTGMDFDCPPRGN